MRITIKVGCILIFIFLAACKEKKKDEEKITFKNVLILGNSITHHLPSPAIGWYGNWGMAASSRDKDFVHILADRFKEERSDAVVNFRNIGDYEVEFWNFDYSKLDSLKNLKPDLIIFRIAENVSDAGMDQHDFGASYLQLIRYFQQNNPNVKLICVSSFWNQPRTAKYISDVCAKNGFPPVEIYKISEDLTNTAWGTFANPAVGSHPSDKGMLAIADSIWREVKKF